MSKQEKPAVESVEQDVQQFDLSQLNPSQHSYVQYGSELVCETPGHHHAQQIDPRKTLVMKADGSLGLEHR